MKRIISILLIVCHIMIALPVMAEERFMPSSMPLPGKGKDIVFDNDILYVAMSDWGVRIVDASEPENLKVIVDIDVGDFIWSVATDGVLLYAIGNENVYVYDVRELSSPKKICETVGAKISDKGRSNICGDILAVFGGKNAYLYNVSNPKRAQLISKLPVSSSTMAGYYDGRFVYYADGKKLVIYDATIPDNPQLISQTQIDTLSYCEDIYVEGDVLYAGAGGSNAKLNIIDITDKAKVNVISAIDVSGGARVVKKDADILYTLGDSCTMTKFNVSDLKNVKMLKTSTGRAVRNDLEINGKYVYAVGDWLSTYSRDYDSSLYPPPKRYDMSDLYKDKIGTNNEIISVPFTDISGHWAERTIAELYQKDFLDGVSDTAFIPDKSITRAEFITMIVKLDGEILQRYKLRFTDVKEDAWYSDYMETAYQKGYIPPEMMSNNLLMPETDISREEMAVVAERYWEMNNGVRSTESEKVFADDAEISDWARTYIYAAYDNGIIEGVTDVEYAPKQTATRAQSAKIMENILTNIKSAIFLDNSKYDIADNKPSEFDKVYDVKRADPVIGEWNAPPVVYNVTDAVKKGNLITFYGEGLTEGSKVYFSPSVACAEYQKPATAVLGEIASYDKYNQMLTAIVPDEMTGATYTAYIENEYGISYPIAVNNSFLQYIDRDKAVVGSTIKILGENLDAREFDGELATNVVFVPETGDKVYPEIVSVNPFCVEVKLPVDMPLGIYKAYITNDGIRWNSEQGEKTVYEKYTKVEVIEENDPYKTGIPWAGIYKWNNVLDVTKAPYNLTGDGTTDDTEVIQQAIDDAHKAGGGIVYLPAGTYRFSGIQIDSNVVLMGDDMESTELIYTYPGETVSSQQAIGSRDGAKNEGKFGFYNLAVKLDSNPLQGHPDAYFWIGMDWGAFKDDKDLLKPKYIFMKGVKLDTPMEERGGRGLGVVMIAKSHAWFEDNIMYGIRSIIISTSLDEYVYVINNRMTSSVGALSIKFEKGVFERNKIEHCCWVTEAVENNQGIFCRGLTYVSENEFRNHGMQDGGGDGELVCTEPYLSGTMMLGEIKFSESNKVYVNVLSDEQGEPLGTLSCKGNSPWSTTRRYSDGWHIIITQGRGIGQLRTIKSFDKETQSMELYEDWDIIPDNTSRFTVIIASQALNVYNNYGNVSSKGWWMYGSCYNSSVVKNYTINCEGAFTFSQKSETIGKHSLSYFVRMDGNVSEGFSTKSHVNGIGIQAKTAVPDQINAAAIYGSTIRDNTIRGGEEIPQWMCQTEAPDLNGIYIVYCADVKLNNTADILRGVIAEGNHIEDMDRGITIGSELTDKLKYVDGTVGSMSTHVLLKDNTFKNVQQEIIDERGEAIIIE